MIHDIAPKTINNHYDPARRPAADSYVLSYKGGNVLSMLEEAAPDTDTRTEQPLQLVLPTLADLKATWQEIGEADEEKAAAFEDSLIYLFSIDEDMYFLAEPDLFSEVDYPKAEGMALDAAQAACEASAAVGTG